MRVRDAEIRHGAQLPLDDLTTASTDVTRTHAPDSDEKSTTPAHG
jgi:hypothetical protein